VCSQAKPANKDIYADSNETMTENTRTASYIGVALVLLIVAALVNRKPAVDTGDTLAGKVLFPALKSPDDVGGLEIVTSADGVTQTEFTLKRDAGGWTLPSHGGYPADAEKQVASAASSLVDLKALSVVTTSPSQHAEYGVVDPEKASPGAEGIGKLVKVLDKSGNNLARLVIGKKDSEESGGSLDGGELWFVRALPHDAVYRVALPSAKFSTNFEDWIETDLLKLDPWDISEVTLKDYTFDVAQDLTGRVQQNYDQLSTIEVAFSDKDSKWSLKKLVQFENDQPKPVELASDEELNSVRLNEMKTALDDLKIVGVRKKPAGMSANLKANKSIFNESEALRSLAERGFYAVQGEGGQPEILSSDGEVMVRMKDGIEYLLRFGGVAGVGTESKEKASDDAKTADKSPGATKEDETKAATLNRFIMVSAQFNKDLIPPPELEPVPGAADTEKKPDANKAETGETKSPDAQKEKNEAAAKSQEPNKDAARSQGDAPPADENNAADDKPTGDKPAADKPAADKPAADKSAAAQGAEAMHFVNFQADSDKAGKAKTKNTPDSKGGAKSGKTAAPKSEAVEKQPDTAKQDKSNSDPTPALKSGDEESKREAKEDDAASQNDAKATKEGADNTTVGDAKADAKKASPEEEEELALRRKRIETENERKQKEYDEKVKKGEDKARELNARFAEWYYVVSEDTYKKIHLNRDDVIKKKAPEKTTDGPDTDGAGGAAADPLKIPPLDPFQKPDDAAKENDE
jgi:hypothetical protein